VVPADTGTLHTARVELTKLSQHRQQQQHERMCGYQHLTNTTAFHAIHCPSCKRRICCLKPILLIDASTTDHHRGCAGHNSGRAASSYSNTTLPHQCAFYCSQLSSNETSSVQRQPNCCAAHKLGVHPHPTAWQLIGRKPLCWRMQSSVLAATHPVLLAACLWW
jgi:hypothetical protein